MMKNVRRFTAIISTVMIAISCLIINPVNTAEAAQYDPNAMVEEMLVLINEARAKANCAPLYMVDHLNDIANVRSRELIFLNDHKRPNGGIFADDIDYNRVSFTSFAENIASGSASPEETFEMLMNSDEHNSIITNPNFTHIGIGVAYEENSMYGWYWSQVFVSVCNEIPGQKLVTREDLNKYDNTSNTDNAVSQLQGDVNCDGRVNSFDYIILANYYFSDTALNESQINNCDVMQDGQINIADIIVLKKHIVGSEKYETLPLTPDMFI